MRIVIWATHLQTDILALALYLDGRDDVRLLVVAPDTAVYLGQPIARCRPFRAQLLDRNERSTEKAVRRFRADLVVMDNHFPPFRIAPRLVYMWHGLGWKARSNKDVRNVHRRVKQLTGIDPRKRSTKFFAQCYGVPDRLWRVEQWGLHPDNCRIIGMPFSDLLRDPPYHKTSLADRYGIDINGRKTVLISLTWHYGIAGASPGLPRRLLSSWRGGVPDFSRDLLLLKGLIESIHRAQANALLCLHERKRYSPAALQAIESMARRYPRVQIKHKDQAPDNLADLLVADAMVSNLSSFITYYYLLGKPAIHLLPLTNGSGPVLRARLRRGRIAYTNVGKGEPLWMNEPGDNGGILIADSEQAAAALKRALQEPDCCRQQQNDWLERHVHGIDGQTCQRFYQALAELCQQEA